MVGGAGGKCNWSKHLYIYNYIVAVGIAAHHSQERSSSIHPYLLDSAPRLGWALERSSLALLGSAGLSPYLPDTVIRQKPLFMS